LFAPRTWVSNTVPYVVTVGVPTITDPDVAAEFRFVSDAVSVDPAETDALFANVAVPARLLSITPDMTIVPEAVAGVVNTIVK